MPASQQPTQRRYVEVTQRGVRVGETHHRAKLSNADLDQIFALHEAGLGYRRIAQKFDDLQGGISRYTIRDVLTFRRRITLAGGVKRT
jgi:hypothetical protein